MLIIILIWYTDISPGDQKVLWNIVSNLGDHLSDRNKELLFSVFL